VQTHEEFTAHGGDEQLLVKFDLRSKQDKTASKEAGRPIFKEVEYVDIRVPGSPDNVSRPATQRDRQRFPKHYAAFKERVTSDNVEGTLLTEWPQITRSQADELAYFGIKTVEQLAQVSDANGQGLMGFHGMKRKANEWLKAAAQGVQVSELMAELHKRDEQIAEMQAKLEAMSQPNPRKKKATKKAVTQEE
jgi:hypothetical protein